MSRDKIAFLDLPFHRKTRSSRFFIELLREKFDVDVFYVDLDPRSNLQELAQSSYETIVCWQTEFAAPYFLMKGKRVVCVPMYDGVANAPDWYWTSMAQARFVCFSSTLHSRLKGLGLDSIGVQYFQGVEKLDMPLDFRPLKGFFWQRRPEEGLEFRFAQKLIGRAVENLHIHNAPDTENAEDWLPSGDVTVSQFSESGREYKTALCNSNVYVAPRRTEGIGHTLTEAMSLGMCVIAHDDVTANEYIVDGVNGMLIDFGNPPMFVGRLGRAKHSKEVLLTASNAEKLGKAARRSFEKGLENWQQARSSILFQIATAPNADLGPKSEEYAERYLTITKFSRSNFGLYLLRLAKFLRSGYDSREYAAITWLDTVRLGLRALPGMPLAIGALKKLSKFGR